MMRAYYRTELLFVATMACSVPDLSIEERASVSEARDASAAPSDAGADVDASSSEPRGRDSGADVRTGEAPAAGAGDDAAAGGGSAGERASGGAGATAASAGSGGKADPSAPGAAGMGGSAGAPAPTEPPVQPTRACLLWTSINIRNGPPAGAFEGGFETIAGVTTRQYICRIRPAGSTYAIPGKYVDRVGCYVVQRRDGQANDVSVLDGLIDVLVPAPGCTFSWRAASAAELPQGVVDLGDPPDGRNYACRGNNSSIGATSTQVGTIIPSTDDPAVNQCWFESFSNSIQPQDPTKFEALVLEPQ